jgi:hypothetical protein
MDNGCQFLKVVSRKQRLFWTALLFWFFCIIIFVVVATQFLNGVPDGLVTSVFLGSAVLLYVPIAQLYRLKCPHCHSPAGAVPFLKYRFLICHSCRERIECKP